MTKHTDCGMLTFKNEDAPTVVEKDLGAAAKEELAGLDFQPFGDLEEAIRKDVGYLKGSKLVGGGGVKASRWVYEVETGKVRRVI